MNGLTFLILITAPGLVLLLNQWHLKARSGRVSPARPDWDWGDQISLIDFDWPERSNA